MECDGSNICSNCTAKRITYRQSSNASGRTDGFDTAVPGEIFPQNFCLLAFSQIFPYLKTIGEGGWFNWVTFNRKVIVRCPALRGIAYTIKAPFGRMEFSNVEVIEAHPDCPCGYKVGDEFRFSVIEDSLAKYQIIQDIIGQVGYSPQTPFVKGKLLSIDGTCLIEFEVICD
jgi:uncharacterized repeat protein (TIGR04076 family)